MNFLTYSLFTCRDGEVCEPDKFSSQSPVCSDGLFRVSVVSTLA